MSEVILSSQTQHGRVTRVGDQCPIHLMLHRGHLFVCSKGCCCGRTDQGFKPVPETLYHREWERRKLRNRVHLTQSGCLGPCSLANVVLLMFDGVPLWFQGIDNEGLIVTLYDYLEAMVKGEGVLPIPDALKAHQFDYYAWAVSRPAESPVGSDE